MKRLASLLAVAFVLGASAPADDQVRDVQSELKTQGFYYGEINGQNNADTSAAIRRYQIRNGLEVTGTLNKATIEGLGIGGPTGSKSPPAPAPKPPVNLRRSTPAEQTDKDFLRREETKRPPPSTAPAPAPGRSYDPSVVPPPAPLDSPSADFEVLFAGTPYATAPREVQESTLRRAQSLLATSGFYRDPIDGSPGPATEEAVLTYQRRVRLPLTGRLDLETLSRMRLLPGRGPVPIQEDSREPRQSGNSRIYRGIIVR